MKMLVLKDLHDRIARLDPESSSKVLDALDILRQAKSNSDLIAEGTVRSVGGNNYALRLGNWRILFKLLHKINGDDEVAVVDIDGRARV